MIFGSYRHNDGELRLRVISVRNVLLQRLIARFVAGMQVADRRGIFIGSIGSNLYAMLAERYATSIGHPVLSIRNVGTRRGSFRPFDRAEPYLPAFQGLSTIGDRSKDLDHVRWTTASAGDNQE